MCGSKEEVKEVSVLSPLQVRQLEEQTHQFWRASLAWHRVEGFYKGWTVEKLFDALRPITLTPLPSRLDIRRQASSLSDKIVVNTVHKRKHRRKNVISLDSRRIEKVTKIIGQKINQA